MRSIIDVKIAEQKANEIYNAIFNEEIAIMLEEYYTKETDIAEYLGIKVMEIDFEKEFKDNEEFISMIRKNRVSGLFIAKDKTILVNEKEPSYRKRFTIAHEIGHYKLNHVAEEGVSFVCRDKLSKSGRDKKEIAANAFAAELLMPKKLVIDVMKKFKKVISIEDLTAIFGVSDLAMKIRLSTLADDLKEI